MPLSQLLTEIGEAYHGAQVGMYLMSWVHPNHWLASAGFVIIAGKFDLR